MMDSSFFFPPWMKHFSCYESAEVQSTTAVSVTQILHFHGLEHTPVCVLVWATLPTPDVLLKDSKKKEGKEKKKSARGQKCIFWF